MESLQEMTGEPLAKDITPLLSVQAIRPQKYIMQVDAVTGHLAELSDQINGITSPIESGTAVFSLPMLYHATTGKQNPTVDELQQKLEKMRRMMFSIDLTEENEAHFVRGRDGETLKIEDLQLEGYLLPLSKISGTVNGKKAELNQIIQHPLLYTYSKMKRQLASAKITLLNAPINNSTTIPLKTYLLQRIELIKKQAQ